MLRSLFGRGRTTNREIVVTLYEAIVAAARRPKPYADWAVPDTPLGRFEMIALHMMLVQIRLKSATGPTREIAQALIDEFFTEVEHSLRELGIGDMGVPKRMKKLARMFYGRVASYEAAIAAGDETALAQALERNIWPSPKSDVGGPGDARALAHYVLAVSRDLEAQTPDAICAGQLSFPSYGSPSGVLPA